jgi:predicted TIM-barrel fold metal-dependent hydrolase
VTDPDDPSSWPLFARVTAEELAREMSECGVDRACLVQGYAAYRFDNGYAVDAAERDPDRFVSVCAVDIADPEAPNQLDALARSPRMRGVRIVSGFSDGDPTLDSPEARRVWEVAERLGIVVIAFSLGDRLGGLAEAARIHRAHPVVLDHCGFVDIAGELDRLGALVDLENVFLKVSTRVLVQSDPVAIIDRLVDCFGIDRLLWGSDYPASHERSYREWVELARTSTRHLTSHQAERFLAGTALALWPQLRGEE